MPNIEEAIRFARNKAATAANRDAAKAAQDAAKEVMGSMSFSERVDNIVAKHEKDIANYGDSVLSRYSDAKMNSDYDSQILKRREDAMTAFSKDNGNLAITKDSNGGAIYVDKESPIYKRNQEELKAQRQAYEESKQGKYSPTGPDRKISNNTSAIDDAINNKKGISPQSEMINRLDREKNAQLDALKNASGNKEKLNSLGQQHGIEGDATEAAIRNAINNKYQSGIGAGPNVMDKMWGYKMPQKALGVGTTAWLVSSMAANRGQQSNSELYGQQTPYQ